MNARNRIKTVLTLAAVAMAILTAATAQATTITGVTGGDDSWNTASNWDAGVPSGVVDAVVGDGVLAQVNNPATPIYSGTLTLNADSTLKMISVIATGHASGSENAVEGTSGITMNEGSKIQINMNYTVNLPPIELAGGAAFETLFGASDWATTNFDGAITGDHTLTLSGFNGHIFKLNAANSFPELIVNAIDRWKLEANVTGSLGTGNVTINPRYDGRSASLYINAANAMADTATLTLNGTAGQGGFSGTGSDYVIMNADDTIAGLFVYGIEQPPGDYDSSESWLQGTGTLSVIPINPTDPFPAFGITVPAGDVELSWTNLPANVGTDVYVDVWFGTDPESLTQVIDAGLNTASVTVSAPVADTYYWQANSYLNGAPTGDPIQGTVFTFNVSDTDGDGMPDTYELANTDPPSSTALNPGDDLEPDGLTNIEEYNLGTNPNDPDTDDDTLIDGDELAGAGLRPPTDPLNADSDNDGLNDGVETNTGTYVSDTDTGTDPTVADCDGDGLVDGVETNTGTFVSETDTGTSPLVADSDVDGAEDWYEVAAAYTDPTISADKPVIPYPLPDPDGSTGATDKPVKVYILSGQSNMVGFGRIDGSELGTLDTITNRENKFQNLVDGAGAWTVCNDVMYRGVITAIGDAPLTPGFGANSGSFGPELGFGCVMGYYHNEPVIVLKSSQGNRSLGWDCLPPGSLSYVYNSINYGGYGDYGNWPVGEDPPTTGGWYAGKQYDDFFLDEADMGPKDWVDANLYTSGCQVRSGGVVYNCKAEHTSSAASEPGIGAESSTYWDLHSIVNVVDVLDNFASEYPEYAAQGFEIAGFGWWQGHKDQYDASYADRYEFNLVNFINETRQYYENRYPANTIPDAPFVVATIGFGGVPYDPDSAYGKIHTAQMAVGDPAEHPEFANNVTSFDTLGYWRDSSVSPTDTGYHYNHNAETYMLTGDALGRAMIELESGSTVYSVNAGDDMITWSGQPVELDATVQDGVTVTSYAWSAVPADGVVFDPNAYVEDPTVMITKATLNPSAVELTLTVNDGENPPVTDAMTIDVYDDACAAALAVEDYPADLDGDCVIGLNDLYLMAEAWLTGSDLSDFAQMAETWLDDYALTKAVPKQN